MDKNKFEIMVEMMKDHCTGEGGMVDCWSMMSKMMRSGEGEKAVMKKEDPGKRE
jgi:hypothetical protein